MDKSYFFFLILRANFGAGNTFQVQTGKEIDQNHTANRIQVRLLLTFPP